MKMAYRRACRESCARELPRTDSREGFYLKWTEAEWQSCLSEWPDTSCSRTLECNWNFCWKWPGEREKEVCVGNVQGEREGEREWMRQAEREVGRLWGW